MQKETTALARDTLQNISHKILQESILKKHVPTL